VRSRQCLAVNQGSSTAAAGVETRDREEGRRPMGAVVADWVAIGGGRAACGRTQSSALKRHQTLEPEQKDPEGAEGANGMFWAAL